MAPAQRFIRFSGSSRRAVLPSPLQSRKYRTISDILERAKYAVLERENYGDVKCEQCGSGEEPDQLLLCDKCDKGYHMKCLRPIVVKVPYGSWLCPKCCGRRTVRSRQFCVSWCLYNHLFRFSFVINYPIRWLLFFILLLRIGFSQKKIFDFFRIEKCRNDTKTCASLQGKLLWFNDTIVSLYQIPFALIPLHPMSRFKETSEAFPSFGYAKEEKEIVALCPRGRSFIQDETNGITRFCLDGTANGV